MKPFLYGVCCFWLLGSFQALLAQETSQPAPSEGGATLSGSVVLPERFAGAIALDELQAELVEEVKLPLPPRPENWSQLTPEEQTQWWNDFQASEAGQAFLKSRQETADRARRIPVRLEANGNFTVYDVPPGTYGLSGRVDKELNQVTHAFEVIGRLVVAEKTDEVLVGKLPITVTPLWENGHAVPSLTGQTLAGEPFDVKQLKGKRVLVLFWLLDSPPSLEFQKRLVSDLQEISPSRPLEFISACLDRDAEKVKRYVAENPLPGTVILCGDWNGEVAQTFGLSSFPSLWLINRDQQFQMTDFEFGVALQLSRLPLKDILVRTLDGQAIPNYPPPPPESETTPNSGADKAGNSKDK